jgi:hypothetical protein
MIDLGKLVVDPCPDAFGYWTVRLADGTDSGDTDTCIATVYDDEAAKLLVTAYNRGRAA